MRLVTAASLHSFKMGFVPLICICYMFLCIRLHFYTSFWEVPKHSLFAFQKKREVGFRGMVYHIFFLFSSSRLLNPITVISEVWFKNREFHSLIFGVIFRVTLTVILGVILNFLSTFLLFCPLFCPLFCLLFRFNIYYLHNLEYHFHCFGVQSKFWGSYYRTCYH